MRMCSLCLGEATVSMVNVFTEQRAWFCQAHYTKARQLWLALYGWLPEE